MKRPLLFLLLVWLLALLLPKAALASFTNHFAAWPSGTAPMVTSPLPENGWPEASISLDLRELRLESRNGLFCSDDPVGNFDPIGLETAEERAAEASGLSSLLPFYSEEAQNEELDATLALQNFGLGSREYDTRNTAAQSAKELADEMERRAYILAHGTEGDYRTLVFGQYGVNNPNLNKIAGFYADKFNDQATLNWLSLQHPAPSPHLDPNGLAMMLLFPEAADVEGAMQVGGIAEDSAFEQASEIENGRVLAATRGIPKTGIAEFDRLAVDSEEFEGFLGRVRGAGFDIKPSTLMSPSEPAFFRPRNMTFYYNPESMTNLDMLHENVHLEQFTNAGNFRIGGGIQAQYELGAYSFEYQLGLQHRFSSEYMSYLETMINVYGGL